MLSMDSTKKTKKKNMSKTKNGVSTVPSVVFLQYFMSPVDEVIARVRGPHSVCGPGTECGPANKFLFCVVQVLSVDQLTSFCDTACSSLLS